MVPLLLELLALQICQGIDGVHIVEAVPVGAQVELAGEPFFQFPGIPVGHADKAAGDAPGTGILDDGVAMLYVYKKIKNRITPAINAKVEDTLNEWFGVEYELIET